MNKLDPEHLHLLIDEPIYVLGDQAVAQEQTKETEAVKEVAVAEPAEVEAATEEKVVTAEVEPVEAKVAEPVTPLTPAAVKDILIITEDKNHNLLAEEDEIFLLKGLNALNVDRKDILLHNSATSGPIKPPLQHTKQIVFKENPDNAKLYQVLDASGIAYLECHLLRKISADQELKKQFWLGLKALFKS